MHICQHMLGSVRFVVRRCESHMPRLRRAGQVLLAEKELQVALIDHKRMVAQKRAAQNMSDIDNRMRLARWRDIADARFYSMQARAAVFDFIVVTLSLLLGSQGDVANGRPCSVQARCVCL